MPDLPTTMRAVACPAPNPYDMVERPVPRPRPGEIVVQTRTAGLCTSDIPIIAGMMPDPTLP